MSQERHVGMSMELRRWAVVQWHAEFGRSLHGSWVVDTIARQHSEAEVLLGLLRGETGGTQPDSESGDASPTSPRDSDAACVQAEGGKRLRLS